MEKIGVSQGGGVVPLDIYLHNDQPMTCPKCGARTEIKSVSQVNNKNVERHQCLDCEYEFIGEHQKECANNAQCITVIIAVKQLVEDDELDYDDRCEDIPGTYEIKVPGNVAPDVAVSIALDEFHETIPVSMLEDFEFTTYIDGKPIEQSDDEGYSHSGEALSLEKVSDELPEYYLETGTGRLWWIANSEQELESWKPKLDQCTVIKIERHTPTQIDVVFELEKAKALEILGYQPDTEEWLKA